MQKTASKHSNTIQARASAMMITELFGHVTFGTHFLEFRLLAGAVRRISPGITAVAREIENNAYAKFWVAYCIAHSLILSIFRSVPGMYRKQWLCKILI